MKRAATINHQRARRKNRTRGRMQGTHERPRVSVFRSNTRIYVQFIDDVAGKTLCAGSALKGVAAAEKLGHDVAQKARGAGVAKAVFDRGAYRYHGSVKALAEGVRAGGVAL
jgi:large subunit ribosomal protein L18